MNQLLKVGQIITTESSRTPCKVEKFLGGGGQGEVYLATMAGKSMALKWYFRHTATPEQRQILEDLVERGAPDRRFLWPQEMATDRAVPGYGYIMPLRDARYKGLVDLAKGRAPTKFAALVTAGYQLADSYFQLHCQGLCYRDISFGNVFFDPATGNVLICDNDNVAINGKAACGVLGTQRFMAPEIVRGEALPSKITDLYSLAVLLFYMYFVNHPLEGKKETSIRCLDNNAMTNLYGTKALFIFDPQDDSNAPDPNYHSTAIDYWPIFPRYIRNLFIRSFTNGIRDPHHGRVMETEWRPALIRLRDSIFYCPHCKVENFFDAEATNSPGKCWACEKPFSLPPGLRIGKEYLVMLNSNTQLFPHHLVRDKAYDFSQALAEVSRHPSDPTKLGLKNLATTKWVATTPEGNITDVESGRSVRLAHGTKINFGSTEGEVRF